MKIHIRTYGCQMSERDSEAVAVLLRGRGHEITDDESAADAIVVNTCSVREKAEEKALGKLGLMTATKREFPERIVGVMGCMVQRLKGDILRRVRGLDFAVGTQRLSMLPDILDAVASGRGPIIEAGEEREDAERLTGHIEGSPSAFVNILFGCNRRCTYCIVPDVRGPEWSRPAHRVVDEVKRLVASGVREVTLLGQSVMSYGRANEVRPAAARSPRGFTESLPLLLEALNDIEGLERLRFTSGHPSGCTGELARAMAELPAVCEHLHLPVQSGSDRILAMMKREYTSGEYHAAVRRLRSAVPGMAITTDVIVGFPTEQPEDFEATRALMEEMACDNAFIFKYSPRPGTPAAERADDVSAVEKLRRNHVLLEDQERRGLAINQALVGREVEVLVEGVSQRNSQRWAGRSRTNKVVVFEPPRGVRAGDLIRVGVERAMPQTLYGRALTRECLEPAAVPAARGSVLHV